MNLKFSQKPVKGRIANQWCKRRVFTTQAYFKVKEKLPFTFFLIYSCDGYIYILYLTNWTLAVLLYLLIHYVGE